MKLSVFGAAGCAKEIDWLLSDINRLENKSYEISCFIDRQSSPNLFLGKPVLAEPEYFANLAQQNEAQIILGIAEPHIRYAIAHKLLKTLNESNFPSFKHPHHNVDSRLGRFKHGFGNIFCFGAAVMPDTSIGNFLYQSIHTTIGHDCVIGDALSLFPGAKISGNVKVGNCVLIGAGATIKERVEICDNVVIGAGAVVVKSIVEPGVYAGVPAKRIK